ncbi:oxygenase MpaB family protein [Mycobacterium sp. CVI_P3]|uniref:Oxygenase MpaB family protein n=1 Tax=Mycobacterium pinniadriaticum TaxID=2994102 RepID=A0ABT3S8D8_9MYCO|nr:oxygenase MpaB family protein [Mycobacterium pinniadriaticum]MCX2929340.1 oxygenase MpaB family protein [Mycobacterium pinniadriaticum]MCX2935764.1 oxygenase MpaB family protein [Mycobacterium pinniadriaticum]
MTVTGERPQILLEDVDFNRRDHPDRPLRPIPPGRDHFADQWRQMREVLFGEWIDIDREVEPNDLTRLRDDYFWQRDELMIGVVDAFEHLGAEEGRALFEQALTQGIASLDDPPQEFVDLFEHLDQLPAQFDLVAAERGRMLAMSSTWAATTIIRSWAFYETAMTGDISAATGATGRFADDGPRRFIETARVFAEFTLPDIFDRHSEAFQDVVRVRLMHALASRGLRRKWGDDVYLKFGEPIPVTSLLGFGSGMLLGRLVDHAFGRKLTPQQLEDLAEYSTYSGRLWGAPELLHSPNGLELIKSLNYVLARGGNPSPWRAELVDAIAGPAHLTTLADALPDPIKKVVSRYANQITASIALAPAGVVYGYQQIEAMVAGTLFESLGYDFERRVRVFANITKLNVGIATVADKLPWSNPIRERRKKSGAAARERVAMLNKIARGKHIPLTFTHHDRSTKGEGFTG